MENFLSIALNPDLAWPQNPFTWEVSGTHLCGRSESPELAFRDGIAAYTNFVSQQAGWDG